MIEQDIIEVQIVVAYGDKEFIYPMNETALTFCELLKQKTLTRSNIDTIRKLGYQVKVIAQEAPEL